MCDPHVVRFINTINYRTYLLANIKPLMPKIQSSETGIAIQDIISEFRNEHLQSDGHILYYFHCEKSIAFYLRFQATTLSSY